MTRHFTRRTAYAHTADCAHHAAWFCESSAVSTSHTVLPSLLTSCFQARHWKKYAEVEITAGNTQQVKTIFSRCLLSCPSVDLWQTYLTFIQKVTSPSTSLRILHK
jgi:hypothetical protein